MLKTQKPSEPLILPRINTRNKREVSNKWKKAERRVTIISFPKIKIRNRKEAKEKSAYKETFNFLPTIKAEFQSDSDYFTYYLKAENILTDNSLIDLEKFTLFCEDDEKQEKIASTYFTKKGREMLKHRQLQTLEESDVSKQKEREVLKQLNEQTNGRNFEKSYYTLVEDFANLSFELCSLKSFEQSMPQNDDVKVDYYKENAKINLYNNEISKEETWISKIEEQILEIM